jgi:hypothetical protein
MTENEELVGFMFDEAMKLRDAGDLVAARRLLARLVKQLGPNDETLLWSTHLQLGYIAKLLGEDGERESHFRAAAIALPTSDLASLGLFHTLFYLGRFLEAFQEMVRLLRLKHSERYEEMLLPPEFGSELTGELRDLVLEARQLLAKRRPN